MAKKDREKKKASKTENPNPENIARREAKMQEQKIEQERINRGRTLMMMGLALLFIATVVLILADVFNHSLTAQFKMFAYGLTVVSGISLLSSRRYAQAGSRRWLLIAGLGAVFLGLAAFLIYAFGDALV